MFLCFCWWKINQISGNFELIKINEKILLTNIKSNAIILGNNNYYIFSWLIKGKTTMFNIEIIGKIMIDDFVNIINCNVYDSKKNLIKSDVCGTHYLHDNDVKLIDFDIVNKSNIDTISDLCNNSVVFHFLNLRDLTYENR